MRFESNLCHLSENKAVVKVKAWHNDKNVGSALGEGPTVELAEDNAISRLNKRLNIIRKEETNLNSNDEYDNKKKLTVELPIGDKIDNINFNQEPSDWSNELSAIDLEIERLKWSRIDEINFLQKNLGYNNRNKITNYNDIVNYLKLLKNIDNINRSNDNNTNIKSLIEESDSILKDLSWETKQGREYLQKEFNVSTRKELDEKQLISFVAKLKSIRNQYQTP